VEKEGNRPTNARISDLKAYFDRIIEIIILA